MRRRQRQHRCTPVRGWARADRARSIRLTTRVAALGLVTLLAPAAAVQAQSKGACAKVPGAEDKAAIFQYCPKRAEPPPEQTAEAGLTAGGATADDGSGPGPPKESVGNQDVNIPLTDYPGSEGVNLIIFLMLAALGLLGARALNRRYGNGGGGSARWRLTSRPSSEGSDQA